ncbi:hypothetical protein NL676_001211 [Syzygium grande]|nr:hypothetical protein NL676_001211 [Syzygium grande]
MDGLDQVVAGEVGRSTELSIPDVSDGCVKSVSKSNMTTENQKHYEVSTCIRISKRVCCTCRAEDFYGMLWMRMTIRKDLPQEIDSTHGEVWDAVLVNNYLCELRVAKKLGRKERKQKEAQAVLAEATAAAAASSRISSLRKDLLDGSANQENLVKLNTTSGRPGYCSQLMPRARETVPKVSVHMDCYRSVRESTGPWYCELWEELRSSGVLAVNFDETKSGSYGLQCNYGHCQSTFHPSCAQTTGLFMSVKTVGGKLQHRAYCGKHSVEQKAKAESQKYGIEELKSIKQIRVQ